MLSYDIITSWNYSIVKCDLHPHLNTGASELGRNAGTKSSIRTKIFVVILVPALILTSVILLDYRNLSLLGRSAERILSENYKSIEAAQRMRHIVETTRNAFLLGVFGQTTPDSQIRSSTRQIAELLLVCHNNITEPDEKPILDRMSRHYEGYQAAVSELMLNTERPISLNEQFRKFISLSAEIITEINALVLINERAMEEAERETRTFVERALRYTVGVLILGITFALLVSYVLSRRISKPLTELAGALSTIKEGSGVYPQFSADTKDEIGFLTSEFNRLFARLKAYDQSSADKLLAEKEKVHQSEIAKARFIADLSHQLKTPMTSLAMSVGMLYERKGELSREKERRLIETAKEDCHRLSTLINELVDIARLEAMVTPREKEVLDIAVVIKECIKPLTQQAAEKNIRLELDIEKEMPPVAIDSLRFPWVITNLAGNALRYTDSGGRVTLKVRRHSNRVYVECADTGTGIKADYLDRIFDRYSQFSEREKSGTIGLGLAIVKDIVEQHGGEITVKSHVGKGTVFSLWIPLGTGE
jgi:signal transduction histidine kinase